MPLVSQPSSAPGASGSEQSDQGALQVGLHTPPEQARALTLVDEQGRLQSPQ